VNNRPTQNTDPSGLDDREFENVLKDSKFANNEDYLNKGKSIEGKTPDGQKITFKFLKAQDGEFKINKSKLLTGTYVKIQVEVDSDDYNAIHFIQLVQRFSKDDKKPNVWVPVDPEHKVKQLRADWANANAPSKGWYIDSDVGNNLAFYGRRGFDVENGPRKSILWDAPGDFAESKNLGKRFITCAIGFKKNGDLVYLGSVKWGYYIKDSGATMILMDEKNEKWPEISTKAPEQLGHCLYRWNEIDGNRKISEITHVTISYLK
jgi:hypothetical protein